MRGKVGNLMGEGKISPEKDFSLCWALCVEPDEMWRYDGVVYRVHENRRQFLLNGEWLPTVLMRLG